MISPRNRARLAWIWTLTVLCCLAVARPCRAEPIRILVSVGHRLGLAGEAPLKHAVRDATRVRDVFVQLGDVRREHAIVLEEPSAAALMAALDRAAVMARGRRPEEVTLVFYFSGHGDRERLHLGSERVALRDLDAKLAAVPAGLRIVVADACRTADVRGKGFAADEPFAITVDGSGSASGIVRIHASADGEVAQESDELGGAVFTHYWLTGLSGAADVDADARVTLPESYSFAYSQTLYRSARASGVLQRPAAQFDLKEAAPVVLTHTATSSAIVMPRATDAHYLIYGLGSRTVVGEMWSSPSRAMTLAVAPGKYVVQRRGGGRSAAAQIAVGRGEQRELRAADFQAVPEEALARKGGDLTLFPHELGAGYTLVTSRLVDLGHEFAGSYGHTWESGMAISARGFGGFGTRATTGQDASVAWVGVDGLLEKRLRLGASTLRLGAGTRLVGNLQTLRRTDADRLALAGYVGERTFRGLAGGAHALAGFRAPLGMRAWIELDARGELLAGMIEDTLRPIWSAGLGASTGLSF